MEKICKYCKEIYVTNKKRSEVCDICKKRNHSEATKDYWENPVYRNEYSIASKKRWQNSDYLKKMEIANIKRSEFMKNNNPMKNPITAKKVSVKTKENWDNGKINLSGENSKLWKGDNIKSYSALHTWIRKHKYNFGFCEICGKISNKLDLANVSGKYIRDFNDFEWLCRGCHNKTHGKIPPHNKIRRILPLIEA
jgi:hypothetical protein